MKYVILFGIGNNGKEMIDAYDKYDADFKIVAVADNNAIIESYHNLPVIRPERITDYSFDEIWVASIYYSDIRKQLIDDYGIAPNLVRYVECPMPFLEKRVREKYKKEILDIKKCGLQEKSKLLGYIYGKWCQNVLLPVF